ncbi:MAG: hypothetical protein ACRDTR_24515 [Rubrobacter sp.]
MCGMSESSLHPFGAIRLRSLPGSIKLALGRLVRRRRRQESPASDPALDSLAASAVRGHAEAHAALFERAQRLMEKAERLDSSGTPSESASNRAERARGEVEAGLTALRASFAASVGGSEAERAFDREVERRYPTLGPAGQKP